MNSEKKIQAGVLAALGSRADIRLFRNTVGHGFTGELVKYQDGVATLYNARRVTFGLCEGSSDLIGLKRVTVTPEMVGSDVAVFLAVEVKSERGRPTKDQTAFIKMVNDFGGVGVVTRSVEEAEAALN
jgi:hypothetical protein